LALEGEPTLGELGAGGPVEAMGGRPVLPCRRRRRDRAGARRLSRRFQHHRELVRRRLVMLDRPALHGRHRPRHPAPQDAILGGERLVAAAAAHDTLPASARGSSAKKRAGWRTTPAISPAALPEPAKRSPRAGPTMADPVSCAIINRAKGWLPNAVSVGASMKKGVAKVCRSRSTAIERPAVSGTLAAATGPSAGSETGASRKKI